MLVHSATIVRGELIESQKSGPSSSPTWIQGPKVLSHSLLLLGVGSRELDQRWSKQDLSKHPCQHYTLVSTPKAVRFDATED